MRLTLLAASALLLTVPAASAHHWTWDEDAPSRTVADSGCEELAYSCLLAYLCTGGAPPQAVDMVLYCVNRAVGEADEVALYAPAYAWLLADSYTRLVENSVGDVHDATVGTTDIVNGVLCDQVWSFFCSTPVEVPEHIPVADPIGDYPL